MQKQQILFASSNPHSSNFPVASINNLYEKYSSSQNYYHTILIANITQRRYKRESIVFEDIECYGSCSEYLKRSYKRSEYENKYWAFKQYYFYHEDCPRIFGNRNITDIYETWHEKKRDLVYKKLNIFDQSASSQQSTVKPAQKGNRKVNKSNLLLNISQYNPKSSKYYLKQSGDSDTNTSSKRNMKSNRIETNESVKLCKNMSKDISKMLMKVNNDLSNITNMNLSIRTQEDGPQSQWDRILLGTVNSNKNQIQFNNTHGQSRSHNINKQNAQGQGQKVKIIMSSFGFQKKQKDFNITKKNIPKQNQFHQNDQKSKSKLNKQIYNDLHKQETKFDLLEQNYDDLRSSNKTQEGKVRSILLISDSNKLNKNFSQKYTVNNQPNQSNNNNVKNYQNTNKAAQGGKVQSLLKRSQSFSPRKSCFKQQRIVNKVSSVKKIKLSHQQNVLNRSPGKRSQIQKLPVTKNGMSKNAIAKNTDILEPIHKIKQTSGGLTQNNRQLSLSKKERRVQQFSDTRIVNDFQSYKSEFLPPSKSLATLRPSQDFNCENKLTVKLKSRDVKILSTNFEKQRGMKSVKKEGKESERKISLNVPSLTNRYFNK